MPPATCHDMQNFYLGEQPSQDPFVSAEVFAAIDRTRAYLSDQIRFAESLSFSRPKHPILWTSLDEVNSFFPFFPFHFFFFLHNSFLIITFFILLVGESCSLS